MENDKKKDIFSSSHYVSETGASSGYTIDSNGIINKFYHSWPNNEYKSEKIGRISDNELMILKDLISRIKINYIEMLNPESIINPETDRAKVELYNDYGVTTKSIYNEREHKWIELYNFGDKMGYNYTEETTELIKLCAVLYEKYVTDNKK